MGFSKESCDKIIYTQYMQKRGGGGCQSVAPGAFPSFVTDAFAPGKQAENKIVIPIEDEDFQAVYYFLCLEKEARTGLL